VPTTSDALRVEMAARGAWANIRPMDHRKRRPTFSAFLYRYRNMVERFFNRLKHFRAVATRYGKRDDNFLASSNSRQSASGCGIMSR
jgi:transposase